MWALDDFLDFKLFGLLPVGFTEVKMIYFLNQKCNFRFKRVEDLDIVKNHQTFYFSCYEHHQQPNNSAIYLLANRSHSNTLQDSNPLLNLFSTKEYLVPEKKEYSYFLKTEEDENRLFPLNFEVKNKMNPMQIEVKSLKSKNNLIF